MGVFRHLIPGHLETGSVSAEYGTGRIDSIRLRIVIRLCHHLFRIMAGLVPPQAAGQSAVSFGIGSYFSGVIPHGCHRHTARQYAVVSFSHRRIESSVHPGDI